MEIPSKWLSTPAPELLNQLVNSTNVLVSTYFLENFSREIGDTFALNYTGEGDVIVQQNFSIIGSYSLFPSTSSHVTNPTPRDIICDISACPSALVSDIYVYYYPLGEDKELVYNKIQHSIKNLDPGAIVFKQVDQSDLELTEAYLPFMEFEATNFAALGFIGILFLVQMVITIL